MYLVSKPSRKISKDLLKYSLFSGCLLGLLCSLPVFLLGVSKIGLYLFWTLLMFFPILSVLKYRSQVSILDYRETFSICFLTLAIGSLICKISYHLYDQDIFHVLEYIRGLPIPIAWSFLLAFFLKKQ